jgi:Tfp pilus assembly protein PilN
MTINFNYSTKPFEDTARYYKIIIILAALLLMTLALNIYLYLDYRKESAELIPERDFLEKKLDTLESQVEKGKTELKRSENRKLFKKIAELNQLIDARIFSWTSLLNSLEKAIPSDVMVTAITPRIIEDGISITLSVKTYDYRGILKLITNMDASTVFSGFYPVFENTDNKGGRKEISADFIFKYNPDKAKEKTGEAEDEKQE